MIIKKKIKKNKIEDKRATMNQGWRPSFIAIQMWNMKQNKSRTYNYPKEKKTIEMILFTKLVSKQNNELFYKS